MSSTQTAKPQDSLRIAEAEVLNAVGLQTEDLNRALDRMLVPSIDYADLYFQLSRREAWSLEDGIVKDGSHSLEHGVGARAISGDKTGFAYSDELTLEAILEAGSTARAIASRGEHDTVGLHRNRSSARLYPPIDPVTTLSDDEKVALLNRLDTETRAIDPRVKRVMASIAGVYEVVLIADSTGRLSADVRPLVRINVSVLVEHQGRREQGYAGGGGRYDYRQLFADDRAIGFGREAVRQAVLNLDAVEAPAGPMTVVLGPGWPGVLLHEAVGHGLEGDFNRKGTSAFCGRVGETVASPLCTVVDNGTLEQRRGSLNLDDEGTPTNCTTLIDEGVLCGYMQDKLNARLTGSQPTGNARRESFAHVPMPRMTNTYMLPGPHDPEEIIASVSTGLYASNFGGGQVDITSGKFVFSASEAYLIENGRLTRPVKGASLIGSGPEVLTRVSMVGSDLELDEGVGVCGKDGQSVPVGVGQPTLKIDSLTVGGTAA